MPLKGPTTLDQIEATLRVKLPLSLKEIILKHNAASPDPQGFRLEDGQRQVCERLLSANDNDPENIVEMLALLRNRLPQLTIPVAADPYGNMICLQYVTADDKKPRVVFCNHE